MGETSAVEVRPLRWTLRPLASLSENAAAWDEINSRAGGLPFLESRFLLPLLRHGDLQNGWLGLAHDGAEPVAAALLQRAGAGRLCTVQPSQLPLGAWLVPNGANAGSIARSLMAYVPGHWLALGITQQDPRCVPRPTDAAHFRTMDYIETGWIDVDKTFETFWEARGKNLRSNLRKQRSKLASDGVNVIFERLTKSSDVAQAIEHFARLEGAGWKADIGTAVNAATAQGRFYAEMMSSFCDAGHGQIWQLRFDEKVVAVDLCIDGGDTLVILKTAYDAQYKSLSPAFLLKQEAFKQVFDEGRFKRIEFYGRLMDWHTRWTDQSRGLYHVNVFRWRWVPHVRDWARRASSFATRTPPPTQ